MDSLRTLSTKLGFDNLLRNPSASGSSGFCSLAITSTGISLVKTDKSKSDNKIELSLCTFIPATSADFEAVLEKKVEELELQNIDCSWVLTPDKYQYLQMEELPVTPAEFQAAIRWKVKDLIPFPIEDAVIDSFPVPSANIITAKKA